MADIVDPQVIRFCNEQVRPLADSLGSVFYQVQRVRNFYYAHPEIGTILIANMLGNVIDGAAQDGRSIITGNDVLGVINRADEMNTDYTATGNAKLNTVLKVGVNIR